VAVGTVAVGLLDAALEWEDVGFHLFYHEGHENRFWVLSFEFWVLGFSVNELLAFCDRVSENKLLTRHRRGGLGDKG